jgi:uncharacterized protein (TIGR03905 family)
MEGLKMRHTIIPRGVCPMKVEFDLNGKVVSNVKFYGGCNGNLKAIAILVDGMTVDQINLKLAGNTCGGKSTSCTDQLAKAAKKALEDEK